MINPLNEPRKRSARGDTLEHISFSSAIPLRSGNVLTFGCKQ